jgi:hypothetical protein
MASPDALSRQWAIGVYCDLIEYTGPTSHKYQEYFLNQMGSSLSDPSPEVRQPAAYGAGVAAKFGGPSYSSFCVGILKINTSFFGTFICYL